MALFGKQSVPEPVKKPRGVRRLVPKATAPTPTAPAIPKVVRMPRVRFSPDKFFSVLGSRKFHYTL
ncbi:hypothetical protein KJ865_02710, partial [Myxococcota bacterium]|nr:hypothetical protein [Myxococcota bacterium]